MGFLPIFSKRCSSGTVYKTPIILKASTSQSRASRGLLLTLADLAGEIVADHLLVLLTPRRTMSAQLPYISSHGSW